MTRYRCHKEVWAVKITGIRPVTKPTFLRPTCRGCYDLGTACGHCERCTWELSDPLAAGSATLDTAEGPISVRRDYTEKHHPLAGGYYIMYDDGSQSFSTAKAFEDDHTEVHAV